MVTIFGNSYMLHYVAYIASTPSMKYIAQNCIMDKRVIFKNKGWHIQYFHEHFQPMTCHCHHIFKNPSLLWLLRTKWLIPCVFLFLSVFNQMIKWWILNNNLIRKLDHYWNKLLTHAHVNTKEYKSTLLICPHSWKYSLVVLN